MVTLLRLHSLFETLLTVAKLQTKSRAQESQGRVRAALLIYLNCSNLFGCLFVFCNWLFCCCFSFLMFKFYYIYVTFFSHTQSSSVLTACQRACLGITGVHSLVSNFAERLYSRVFNELWPILFLVRLMYYRKNRCILWPLKLTSDLFLLVNNIRNWRILRLC